jgi:hypothetical protein
LTVEDAHGNTATTTYVVEVEGTEEPPVLLVAIVLAIAVVLAAIALRMRGTRGHRDPGPGPEAAPSAPPEDEEG